MKYDEFIKNQLNNNQQIKQICDLLLQLKTKKIFTFSHDDPDGITSAIIFKRLTDKLGIINTVFLPPKFELTKEELDSEVKNLYLPDAVFIIDKGTVEKYNDYTSVVKKIVVIDHHPPIGKMFDNLFVYNPSIEKYTSCSVSLLTHIVSSSFNLTDKQDDFLALIGLKCDWAIDTMNNNIPDFCKPFYEDKVKIQFQFLTKKVKTMTPTMFDVVLQNQTCLLNRVAELFFALTGGGFQYFYNDYDKKLKIVDQPKFCFETFVKNIKLKKFGSVSEFINLLNKQEQKKVKLIYKYFNNDWTTTAKMFDQNTVLAGDYSDVKIYIFFGNGTKLMPMVGSIKLYQYAKGKEAVVFMINLEPNGGTHISFRGNTDKIHLGKIASSIADKLIEKYGNKNEISGGGHPRAAELKTRQSGVPYLSVLTEFFDVLKNFTKDEIVKTERF